MRILLTGGNGFLGHNLIGALIDRGHEVQAIVRRPETMKIQDAHLQVMKGDFLNYEELRAAATGCEAIIHAAAATDMALSYDEFARVNVGGSQNVIKVADTLGIDTIVFISTANTIGYGTPEKSADENAPMEFPFTESYYAQTKARAEQLFMDYASSGKHIVILNPGFMLGAFDTKPSSGRLIMSAYRKPIMLTPKGGKCFIHVKDVAAAAVEALSHGSNGERYFVGNYNLSLYDFYRLQKKVCGYRQWLIRLPDWMINGIGCCGDALEKLGLRTQVSLRNTRQLCVMEYYDNAKARRELSLGQIPLEEAITDFVRYAF